MHPTLFELPVVGPIPAYGVMVAIGFYAAVFLARREANRTGIPGEKIVDLALLMLVVGMVGARLFAVLFDGQFMDFVHLCTDSTLVQASSRLVEHCTADSQCGYDYLCNLDTNTCYPPRDCLAALKFWQGGLTFYGGVLAAVPVGLWQARRQQISALQFADLLAPAAMVGLFFGRIGCFLAGCCYGAPTDAWSGVTFGATRVRPAGPLHPTQLYEAAAALVLFAVLYLAIRPRKRGDGEVFGWLLVLYAVARSVIELYRSDPRGAFGPLSTSQIVSIPLAIAGAYLIARARKLARPTITS